MHIVLQCGLHQTPTRDLLCWGRYEEALTTYHYVLKHQTPTRDLLFCNNEKNKRAQTMQRASNAYSRFPLLGQRASVPKAPYTHNIKRLLAISSFRTSPTDGAP